MLTSLPTSDQLYISKSTINLTMSRRFTLREACNKLELVDEQRNDDKNNVNDLEFISVEDGENDKEVVVDVEGDIKV